MIYITLNFTQIQKRSQILANPTKRRRRALTTAKHTTVGRGGFNRHICRKTSNFDEPTPTEKPALLDYNLLHNLWTSNQIRVLMSLFPLWVKLVAGKMVTVYGIISGATIHP